MKNSGKTLAAFSGRVGLEIAGFRLSLKSDAISIISILKHRYSKFGSAVGAGFRLDVSEAPGRQNPFKPEVLFDGRSLEIKRGDFEAVLDMRAGAGTLKAAPNEQCLDAFLRSFISFLLIRSGGFMQHSAGLVKNGKAYLFLGKSGAGKSTLAKLAAQGLAPHFGRLRKKCGAEVISDEINLVRFEKGRFRVYGSPFWGEMRADGRQGSWPLGGIYLLNKAKLNKVRACTKGEALKLLLRCLVNFDKNPGTSTLIMGNAVQLISKAKFARLEFSKDNADFLSLIS
ncbi:MAG: hypothetical protein Q7R35_17315 [Elusimicrobiota bacterium]|nr:hypothetical protein [Elusimicrobiota bacterium]